MNDVNAFMRIGEPAVSERGEGHTPGPWIVYDDDTSDVLEITCGAREGKVPVATVSIGFETLFDSEQRFNARLIASAPELFMLLKLIIDDLPKNRDWLDPQIEGAARDVIARSKVTP